MYVVKTTKSTREESPSVDIQFFPSIDERKRVNKDNSKMKRETVKSISHIHPKTFNAPKNITKDDRSIAYLLRDLNVPLQKLEPKETMLSAKHLTKNQIQNKVLLNEGLKDRSVLASKESVFNTSNKTMMLDKESSKLEVNTLLPKNICNAVEDVSYSTVKPDHSEASNDTVYHIIELSGNEQTPVDSPCLNEIIYTQQLPLEDEGAVDQKKISESVHSAEAMVENENVTYPLELKRSKYDSSLSRPPIVKRFTAEEIACMGKTPLELVYNYPGRKNILRPEQHKKPYDKEHSLQLKKNTDNFVDGGENDNRICSGCEELQPITTKEENTCNKDLSYGSGINDETNKALAREKVSPPTSTFKRKRESTSPCKKTKVNKCSRKYLSRSIEKDKTDELNINYKQFDCYSEDDIGTDQSDLQLTYWQDICKCFHYGTKSVIKISPILKSMIKGKVCVIEVEVEDSLRVGMVQKIGGVYGKEIYHFTIENQSEKDTKRNRQLSNSKRKSGKAKFSKSKKDSMNSKTSRSKTQRYKSKNKESNIFEPEEDANKKMITDNISTLPQDIYIKEEIADPYFESIEMNDNQKSGLKHGGSINTREVTTLRDSNNQSHTDEKTSNKEYNEVFDKDSTENSVLDLEIKSEEVFEQDGNESARSEKQQQQQQLLRNENKTDVVTAKKGDLDKRNGVNRDKATYYGDRLTELKEIYLKKSDISKGKGNAIPGEKQKEITPVERDEEGTKLYDCNLCEYSTSKCENAQRHIMDGHTGQRAYLCEVCGSSFKRKSNFHNHKRMHSGAFLFDCQFCTKGFNDRNNFWRHLKRHIGLKEYICEYCDYSFVSSSELKKHVREHTCVRSFKDNSSLNRHDLTHTQSERFMCGVTECDISFMRKDDCVRHIETVHPNAGEVCVIKVDVNEPATINKS